MEEKEKQVKKIITVLKVALKFWDSSPSLYRRFKRKSKPYNLVESRDNLFIFLIGKLIA